ncbi:MFS transporter [Streptomyces tuirus]|uniref:MFS transporter n=1 Tax=Streptomyces tuirus TaxID=68278 RepID=A0A941FBF4_9ACTN|nr:MFS transporter [Streptomyces tuirus]
MQGYTGSVFAAGSIGGPLLGGVFAEHLNWRWIFYVNVPVGLACLALTYTTFHVPHHRGGSRRIDFLGSALLTIGVTCGLLITVWGGTRYAWNSPQILALIDGSLIALVLFVLQERRAREPVLPLRLFRNPVFRLGVPSSALLGISLFGTIVFVPQYFETVRGTSSTLAGLALVPTMAVAVVTGVASAIRVSATGRYKAYPIVGSLLVVAGFAGLTQLDADTPIGLIFIELLVLGAGVGLHMQLIVFIVQNAVPHADVGTATAATMFFRALGER